MRPRRIIGAAMLVLAMAGLVACGGDEAGKAAVSAGTYTDRSTQEQYCDLVASSSLELEHDFASADPESVLPTFHAFADIETLAPEESKADWSAMRSLMQVVVDGTTVVGTDEVTVGEADEAFAAISVRVAEEVEETCGIALVEG